MACIDSHLAVFFFMRTKQKNRGVKKMMKIYCIYIYKGPIEMTKKTLKSDDFAAQTWVSRIWWAANWWCALCTFLWGRGDRLGSKHSPRKEGVFRVPAEATGVPKKKCPATFGSGNFNFDPRRFSSVDSCFGISDTFRWLVGSWKLH